MSIDQGSLGSFGDLGIALGLLTPDGQPNASWFSDPVTGGAGPAPHGLKHLLEDPDQRAALTHFVDQVLGPPEARTRSGATWVPLFQNADPTVTVYAVLGVADGEVRLGFGVEHTTQGAAPTVSTRVHVPLFRFPERDTGPLVPDGFDPTWLALGRPGGEIEIAVDATLRDTAPAAEAASLGGVALAVEIPSYAGDVGFEITLRDLQLPGATAPQTFTLDVAHPDEIGPRILDLAAGLVRAQADALGSQLTQPALRPFAALAGLLGLRDVTDLPALHLADVPTRGMAVLVEWAETVVRDPAARGAWLGQLALLLGGRLDPTGDKVLIPITDVAGVGRVEAAFALRVEQGDGGHTILVPWAEVALSARAGVQARAAVDLLRADIGTGACTAVPAVRVEAVFGVDAGGNALVSSPPQLGVESLHVGIGLDGAHRPTFVLTARTVVVSGAERALVDLSTPDAALAAGADLVTGALTGALGALGDAGDLVARLLGVTATGAVAAISVPHLVADPVGTIRDHWHAVLLDGGAMQDLLGRASALVRGTAAGLAPGTGTATDPWQVELADGVRIDATRTGQVLDLRLAAAVERTVLTDLLLTTTLGIGLARIDFAGPGVTFATGAALAARLARADEHPVALDAGAFHVVGTDLEIEARWSRGTGLGLQLSSDDLALLVDDVAVGIPLPALGPDGRLVLPSPDWDAVETALATLIAQIGMPEVDAAVRLLGWTGTGPHLSLAALLDGDAAAALEAWLADLLLDCDRVRAALGPVAQLLSGFSLSAALGTGNVRDPFRCPVAGEPRAPGLRVWLDPGCAVRPGGPFVATGSVLGSTPPAPGTIAEVLRFGAQRLPDVADLMVGRDSLGSGLQALVDRWRGTDGLVGRPALPSDVDALEIVGVGGAELAALGRTGALVPRILATAAPVVHVGTGAEVLADRPAGSAYDLSGSGPVPQLPAGAGPYFVRLPTPAQAALARPDRGGVGEQAARLVALLAGRAGDLVLVGYGDAGAAAIRAAAGLDHVTDVVTVGTPWADTSYLALTAGLGGDALQLLGRLQRADVPAWPDPLLGGQCTPLQRTRLLVRDCQAVLRAENQLPRADTETRRVGLAVHAVFGSLDDDSLLRGLGAFVADALEARGEALVEATGDPGEVTALHVAVDVPVLDLDLGGLLVGVGAAFETCRIARAGDGIEASLARGLVVELHLGVHDGWLVGGPGSTGTSGDLRWMSARVEIPFDGTAGTGELVLHEARGLGIDRERWPVRAGADGVTATVAVPEVRVLLGDVVRRLRAASPHLDTLLGGFGLVAAAGGLDVDALDRLLHDPAATLRGLVAAAPAEIASALRGLVPGATGTAAAISWEVGPASLGLDLATGALTGSLVTDVEGLLPVRVDVAAGAHPHATLALGTLDEHLGGARLTATAGPGPGPVLTVAAAWSAAGGTPRTAGIWPVLEPAPLIDLIGTAVPALALQGVLSGLLSSASETGRAALETGLSACGLLRQYAEGGAVVVLPLAFVQDPAAYVLGVARSAGDQLAAAGRDVLDALAHLPAEAPPGDGTWPIADGVELRYALDGDALRCSLHVTLDETLDGVRIETSLAAGALLRPGVLPAPVVDVAVRVDGLGLELGLNPGLNPGLEPGLRVSMLRPVPLAPLPIYPDGPGLGQAFETAALSLVPDLLNRLAGLATGPAGLAKDVGALVAELGDALALRETGQFTTARIALFAGDPSAALLAHLPALLGEAATVLARAVNGSGNRIAVSRTAGATTFGLGTAPGPTLALTLDTAGPVPAVDLAAQWPVPGVGTVRLDSLRLSASGVAIGARIGPVPVHAGPLALRPMLSVRAGSAVPTDRLLSLGLALDDAATEAVELRWGLDASPPVLAAVDRDGQGAVSRVSEPDAPVRLLSVGVALAGGLLAQALPTTLLDARVVRMLRGVAFTETATTPDLDPAIGADLLRPEQLLHRLERLLWNVATDPEPLKLTIDDKVTIALACTPGTGDDRSLGVSLSLKTPSTRYTLADGDVKVELEVDASWLEPSVTPGITVYAVHGVRTGATYAFDLRPGISVAGLGVRFTKSSGPLLSAGPVALDGIAVRVYAEATVAGVGGGAQVELTGLAVAPGGAGGSNTVANGIMNDAGASSPSQRPTFDPALAVQRHPGNPDFRVSIRAGRPPGPWWVVVQRQLGPLYVERVGFDSAESGGRVSRIALLFDGRVEIFGLTAAVDQLTITWRGGDLLDIHQWEVDLMGLAVSADLSGIVLAGGLLKTVDGTGDDQVVSYVGMLLGRFGIYGLTVFGGYANVHGDPSFFVFGAVNGPIGGPPAFFVTGLGGGLGINRRLVVPEDPRQFPTYPFIMALDPYASVPDPMTELRRLNDFFGPERGSFWFAAGISFTCFSLVDGIAVVAVAFGNGLEINLLGLARMALPNPAAPLVSIELGLLARFSEREGVFLIRAALTDNSWLLYRDVRLTGGFAFATWWKGPLSGQFVLTVGGYHPDFHVDGYPDVPRVGLVWQVSDDIVIKGGSYFALTSEALMAGVGVEAVADFGWAWARARFGADGLIYFDPFWYDVQVYATISAGVTIDTWLFGEISISITTGCAVHVWGPDFSGEATVQVGPCSVTVPFGSNARREGRVLAWSEFVAKYLEDAGGGTARALSAVTGRGSLPAATGGARSAPPSDGSAEHPFEVFAEFELTLVSTVPTTAYDVGLAADVTVRVLRSDGAGAALGLNPMKSSALSSVQEIRLERWKQDTATWVDDAEDLRQLGHTVGTGAFPIGVWGPPDLVPPEQAPTRLPAGDVLFAGNQVTLVAEASKMSVGPQIDYYKVEAGRRDLPLQAEGSQRVALSGTAAGVTLPTPGNPGEALDAAVRLLFDTVRTRTAAGLQPTGLRSRTAGAAYRGQVAAPPLFGSLTDGLAVENPDTVTSDPVAPPRPAPAPATQDPRVLGYFTAGSGVAFRKAGTTVSGRGRGVPEKRRPAPTTASVHTRLGRSLPVTLEMAPAPGVRTGRTFAPAALPFTAAPVAEASYPVGHPAARSRVAGITGLGGTAPKGAKALRTSALVKRAADAPAALASGDVVVLNLPDHATDVAASRPVLDLGGSARVTVLRGDGAVLLDGVRAGAVEVPAGSALVAVQPDGVVDAVDGCAGWHSRSKIAALSGLAATAAGCTVVVDTGLTVTAAGWASAGDLVADAARVLTRFTTAVRTVGVVVESDAPDRVEDMGLELIGATRATGPDGEAVEPHLVMNGSQVVALYDVVPDPEAGAVAVSVATGGGWRLTGVLGSDRTADALAQVIVRDGLVGATARLGAVAGPGCSPAWTAAKPKSKRAARKGGARGRRPR
ncbi:DUF6603 domain-containing protein [Marmoricola sp. RAF53]|uniref:DUF6603 domain-containing protein n=1 Tax=Marmoricola sp. RAF53 TaxID=3233059 RepID=UPI003F972BAF